MPSPFLEPLIRRLYLSGYTEFFVRNPSEPRHDSNVVAWIAGSCVDVQIPSSDLTAHGPGQVQPRSYIFWPSSVIAGANLLLRHRRLADEVNRAGGRADTEISLLVNKSPTTAPRATGRVGLTQTTPFPYRIEALSLSIDEIIFDYLRMCEANIFNTSNNPVSSRIIAEGVGADERNVVQACERLYADGHVERAILGGRRFYRAPSGR